MYHIFFIHSPIDGQLGCFHVWPVVNSASVDLGGGACIFLNKSRLCVCPAVGLLGHPVRLGLVVLVQLLSRVGLLQPHGL